MRRRYWIVSAAGRLVGGAALTDEQRARMVERGYGLSLVSGSGL
jgi:hypothetical protein